MRVKAVVEYLGSAHSGWQFQPDVPTIQGDLERALEIKLGRFIRVYGSGRTDAGVHALAQVAAFEVPDDTDLFRLTASLNGLTPRQISIVSLQAVAADFDPRRGAYARTYRYTIVHGRPASPLLDDRAWHLTQRVDMAVLEHSAQAVIGRHDFRAFRASDCESLTSVREISVSQWAAPDPSTLVYEVTANAFLKHMVRALVGTMVDCATGRMSVGSMERLLKGADRSQAGQTAPAKGLVLVRIDYPDVAQSAI